MGVQIPPILVVIACKTMLAGPLDENAKFTGYENLEWATEHSMMVCRRHEIQLYDPVEGMQLSPADNPAPPLNPNFAIASQCARAGIRLAIDWDQAHKSTPWRVWRVGAPATDRTPYRHKKPGAGRVFCVKWPAREDSNL